MAYAFRKHPANSKSSTSGRIRYSLVSTLVCITGLGILFAFIEGGTRELIGRGKHQTHHVPVEPLVAARELQGWMESHGFQRAAVMPDLNWRMDVSELPGAAGFQGSFGGSPPMYVWIAPSWNNGEGPRFAGTANVLVQATILHAGRTWEADQVLEHLTEFMDAFGKRCERFRHSPEQL